MVVVPISSPRGHQLAGLFDPRGASRVFGAALTIAAQTRTGCDEFDSRRRDVGIAHTHTMSSNSAPLT